MAKAVSDKLSFDTHLLDVHLTGLQAEVEAKLRLVRRFREQLQRLDTAGGKRDTAMTERAARSFIAQIDEMLETNLMVRETLLELHKVAQEILKHLR
jgi:hypothetical protein